MCLCGVLKCLCGLLGGHHGHGGWVAALEHHGSKKPREVLQMFADVHAQVRLVLEDDGARLAVARARCGRRRDLDEVRAANAAGLLHRGLRWFLLD